MRLTILIIIYFLAPFYISSQEKKIEESENDFSKKMEWFSEAKLGIFIHWGIYSVNGISESWSFFNGYISHSDYMKQLDGFGAEKYDAKEWANIIKESGAKYTVITTKHHDGFALWNSKYGNLNSLINSKSKSDLLTPFVKAIRNNDLKLGLYYSLPDWSYEDYTFHTNKIKRYEIENQPKRWKKFLKFRDNQLNELKKDIIRIFGGLTVIGNIMLKNGEVKV